MNIPVDASAPVKSADSIQIRASIDIVWDILTQIDHWPEWQDNVTEAKLLGMMGEGTRFAWKASGLSFKSQIHTCRPKVMFGWTGRTIGTSAVHNWRFEGDQVQTTVWVEESLQGILPRLFRKYFQNILDSGIKKSLEELQTAAEKNS
ncbi:MAG: SRPBCC family protein [Saprospiraceae bacterium]|nr:SRPBCC family protein [Saprospiraceae bacterium]